ncbi:hypothetical protein MGG_08816 [Pyricularia oryzae 70-15]|uniref:Uncharacterized protein n=1 Tax=Pyricularia oryzae (strain 70-15 / ATCC MYA-4617 / FGSC 8958) TaxID=242507 RepID=G4NFI1_PYRO7|nr:uncharacterized protein MGG_08816 [Pyricularia oryzae 70-15]EHA46788.1 hypothetical protein MGG_08816 [Pyricularia oryzae 70-15]
MTDLPSGQWCGGRWSGMIVDPVITRGRCLASGSGRHSVEKIMLNYGANQRNSSCHDPLPDPLLEADEDAFPESSLQEQIDESTQLVNPHAVLAHARVSKKNVAGAQLYHGQQLVAVKRRRQAARDLVVRAGRRAAGPAAMVAVMWQHIVELV